MASGKVKKLSDRAVSPEEVEQGLYKVDYVYYVELLDAALKRISSLVGVEVDIGPLTANYLRNSIKERGRPSQVNDLSFDSTSLALHRQLQETKKTTHDKKRKTKNGSIVGFLVQKKQKDEKGV